MVFLFNFKAMKTKRYLLLVSIMSSFSFVNMNAQGLEKYQWEYRILLLKDTRPNTDALLEQLEKLDSNSGALVDRDLKIFILTNEILTINGKKSEISASKIIKEYRLKHFKGVVLIGKDSGLKMKEPFVVAPEKIFALIDGMPMRKAEMRMNRIKENGPKP